MQIRFLAICLLALLASCKKDNPVITQDHVTANVTTATEIFNINANNLQATVGRFIVPIFDYPYVSVSGWRNNYEYVRLSLPDAIQTGTFDIIMGGSYSAYFENVATQEMFNATDGSGTITVSSYTGNFIKGSFQFTGYKNNGDSVVVTNGTFEGDL